MLFYIFLHGINIWSLCNGEFVQPAMSRTCSSSILSETEGMMVNTIELHTFMLV